jgi:hypothetical protein
VSCENRRFLRIASGNTCQQAVVRLDEKRTLAVEVLNKSAGGYGIGVPMDSATNFPPGRILVLEVDDLILRVQVAHAALDPEEDRYLIGLEVIAELEDKLAAQQPHVHWYSALWPAKQGLGAQPSGLRDLILATLFCASLLLYSWLPTIVDQAKGKKKSRSTSSASMFSLPWSWPTARSFVPRIERPVGADSSATQPTPGAGNSTAASAASGPGGAGPATASSGGNPE